MPADDAILAGEAGFAVLFTYCCISAPMAVDNSSDSGDCSIDAMLAYSIEALVRPIFCTNGGDVSSRVIVHTGSRM